MLVAIDDLTRGAPQPMYGIDTKADSGKLPGAAITLNPYAAAARFVLSGRDLDRNVKQTATQIAEQVTRRLQESEHLAVLNAAADHRVPEWHSRESTSILRP